MEALQREQTLVDTKYEEMVRGEPPAKKKKIYLDNAAWLQRLVLKYKLRHENDDDENDDSDESNNEDVDVDPILLHLRGIAHNIAYN